MESPEILFQGQLLTLRREAVTLPNGQPVAYEVIRHPGAVAVIPLLSPQEVILVHQFRHAAGGELWEIPAGTLRAGESPEACGRRELEEEIGYRPGRLERLTTIFTAPGFCDEQMTIYLAADLMKTQPALEAGEILRVVPISLERAVEMIHRGEIRDAKTIVGLLYLRTFGTSARGAGHTEGE